MRRLLPWWPSTSYPRGQQAEKVSCAVRRGSARLSRLGLGKVSSGVAVQAVCGGNGAQRLDAFDATLLSVAESSGAVLAYWLSHSAP